MNKQEAQHFLQKVVVIFVPQSFLKIKNKSINNEQVGITFFENR